MTSPRTSYIFEEHLLLCFTNHNPNQRQWGVEGICFCYVSCLCPFARREVARREVNKRCGGLPSGGAVLVGLDYDHLDADGGAQQVNHLLVGEGRDGHLADLHQPAALPQPGLPGEAEGLHVGHDALEVDVEAELAEAVPAQRHL